MTDARRTPLMCRLNLRHRWKVFSTEDGNRWKGCARCGKEKDTTNIDVQFFH